MCLSPPPISHSTYMRENDFLVSSQWSYSHLAEKEKESKERKKKIILKPGVFMKIDFRFEET